MRIRALNATTSTVVRVGANVRLTTIGGVLIAVSKTGIASADAAHTAYTRWRPMRSDAFNATTATVVYVS